MDQVAASINPLAHKLYQEQTKSNLDGDQAGGSAGGSIVGFILLCIAVYFAMKCKVGDHNIVLHLIGALCCSPCYILYHVAAKPCGKLF